MDKLTTEIREAYASYDEINATKAMQLPYLQAVINEALRIHPPGSQGFPRVSPGTEIGGFWVPKGVRTPYPCSPSHRVEIPINRILN